MSREGVEPPRASPRRSRRRASTDSATWTRAPGKGFEPLSPRSERGVLPVGRSRIVRAPRVGARASAALRPAPRRSSTQSVFSSAMSRPARPTVVFQATRPLFNPGSTFRNRATADPASYVEELWSLALGVPPEKPQAKAADIHRRLFLRLGAEGLSLSGGASCSVQCLFKLSITSLLVGFGFRTTKATLWVALAVGRYAASFLAPAAPCEGMAEAPQTHVGVGRAGARPRQGDDESFVVG